MKKILLDCGSHQGGGLRGMIQENNINTDWLIYSWEANPHAFNDFKVKFNSSPLNITSYNAAVGNKDGTITINIQQGNGPASGKGSSIISLDEWRPMGKKPFVETANVPMIDFGKWIIDNLNIDDYIVVKMDIEGAEYDVLERVIETGAINFFNKLYIEWHSSMFSDPLPYVEREKIILDEFKNREITVTNWL